MENILKIISKHIDKYRACSIGDSNFYDRRDRIPLRKRGVFIYYEHYCKLCYLKNEYNK